MGGYGELNGDILCPECFTMRLSEKKLAKEKKRSAPQNQVRQGTTTYNNHNNDMPSGEYSNSYSGPPVVEAPEKSDTIVRVTDRGPRKAPPPVPPPISPISLKRVNSLDNKNKSPKVLKVTATARKRATSTPATDYVVAPPQNDTTGFFFFTGLGNSKTFFVVTSLH